MAAATLMLVRQWGGFDSKTWQIVVDGTPTASIEKHQTVEVPVQPGRHTVQLRSSARYVSPRRSFDVRDGDMVSYTCHAARIWPLMLASLAKPDLWISLRRA
jgi:hypothetical protein